eukprot:jgi/Mesvir1/5468/Mv15522-RA.1
MEEEVLRCVAENRTQLVQLGSWGADSRMEAWVAAVSRDCTRLRSLTVAPCNTLTDGNVATLLSGPAAAQLVLLDLSGCQSITDVALETVGRSCPELLDMCGS